MNEPATAGELLQTISKPPAREHCWRNRIVAIAGVMLTVLGVVIGWHASESALRNRLFQEIKDHGGSVEEVSYFESETLSEIEIQLRRVTGGLLSLPQPLQNTDVRLRGPYFDNEWLKQAASQLGKVRKLELTLSKANITDDGLTPLKDFADLHSLTIDQCGLTGRGIASLSGHCSLQELHFLDRSTVDDAVNEIGTFPSLTFVDLTTTSLTEDGLVWLTRQPNLAMLHLPGNLITPKSVATLNSLPLSHIGTDKVDDKMIQQLSTLTIPIRLHLRVAQLTSASLPDFRRMTCMVNILLEESSSTPRSPSPTKSELEELRRTGIHIHRIRYSDMSLGAYIED